MTRTDFGDALKVLLGDRPQQWLANELGVSQSAISQWIKAQTEPLPPRVFEIERVLGVEPGTLSRLLGYRPDDGADTLSVEAAILADPSLTDDQKNRFLGLFRDITAPAARGARTAKRRAV